MTTWLLFTAAQVANAKSLNDNAQRLEPRLIDNPACAAFGKYTLPSDIITAKGYKRFGARIAVLPTVDGTIDDLFLPPPAL